MESTTDGDQDELPEINFSHTGFEEALLESSPSLPSCSSIGSIRERDSIRQHRSAQSKMSSPKPRPQRVYPTSGSLSSTISSYSSDPDMPKSLPINAITPEKDLDYNHLVDKSREEIDLEDHEEIEDEDEKEDFESTLQPSLVKNQSFYNDPSLELDAPVKITIKPGDFAASVRASTSLSINTLSKLPSKGLSRGLPLAISTKAGWRHGRLRTTQGPNDNPPKFEVQESIRDRFEQDLKETMSRRREMEREKEKAATYGGGEEEETLTEVAGRSGRRRLSVELSMVDDDRFGGVDLASSHLKAVHQKYERRKNMPGNPTESKTTGVQPPRMRPFHRPKRSLDTMVRELSMVFHPQKTDTAVKIKVPEIDHVSRDPVKKKEQPKVAAPGISTAAPNDNGIQRPNTPPHHSHVDLKNISLLHAARLQKTSPTRHSIIPPSPSRVARELWKTAKKIHKNLAGMDIRKQRRELHDLREAAGLPPKDLSALCDWQVDTEYRTVLKGLEKRWLVKGKSIRKSISAWIDDTIINTRGEGEASRMPDMSRLGAAKDTDGDEGEDADFETVLDSPFEEEILELMSQRPTLPRTNSGRVRLPVITSFNDLQPELELQAPAPKLKQPKPRVHLPVIPGFNDPQPSSSKPRVRLPVIESYDAPRSPESIARELRVLGRNDILPLPLSRPRPAVSNGPPATAYIAPHAREPRGLVTPRHRRINLNPSPVREAREVWNEARKRFRNLSSLPVAQQRLQLGAMRRAAGFPDQHVDDDRLIEVYRSEMRLLETRWMGRMDGEREHERGGEASSSAVGSKNWEKLGETSGVEGDASVVEDDGDSEFETTTESLPRTPTPKPGNRRFGRSLR